jgi:hypothetical protein
MNVKYQIFISSTYEDLRKEREQLIKAVLEMGHIPVGMEMFSAADEEQWKLIARQIDQSDYYAVLVAHRYGSVVSSISYTEKEYDYAVQKGVPVLGFILDDAAPWPAERMEIDKSRRDALEQFKAKLRKKPVGLWTAAEDLYGKFSIALMKLISTTPRTGWAPASDVAGPQVMTELTRLSRESAQLRAALEEQLRKSKDDEIAAREKTIRTLEKNEIRVKIMYAGETEWSPPITTTLYSLFDLLGPELTIEKSVQASAEYIALMMKRDRDKKAKWVPTNTLKLWLSDLMTLGLVSPSRKRHPVSDKHEYWTLTDEGRETLQLLRRSRLELGEGSGEEVDPETSEVDEST